MPAPHIRIVSLNTEESRSLAWFCEAERPKVRGDMPGASAEAVGKEVGARWKALTDAELRACVEKATAASAERKAAADATAAASTAVRRLPAAPLTLSRSDQLRMGEPGMIKVVKRLKGLSRLTIDEVAVLEHELSDFDIARTVYNIVRSGHDFEQDDEPADRAAASALSALWSIQKAAPTKNEAEIVKRDENVSSIETMLHLFSSSHWYSSFSSLWSSLPHASAPSAPAAAAPAFPSLHTVDGSFDVSQLPGRGAAATPTTPTTGWRSEFDRICSGISDGATDDEKAERAAADAAAAGGAASATTAAAATAKKSSRRGGARDGGALDKDEQAAAELARLERDPAVLVVRGLWVKTNRSFHVGVPLAASVAALRDAVHAATGVPPAEQNLRARDMPLDEDEATVASLEIADGKTTVMLFQSAVRASAAPLEDDDNGNAAAGSSPTAAQTADAPAAAAADDDDEARRDAILEEAATEAEAVATDENDEYDEYDEYHEEENDEYQYEDGDDNGSLPDLEEASDDDDDDDEKTVPLALSDDERLPATSRAASDELTAAQLGKIANVQEVCGGEGMSPYKARRLLEAAKWNVEDAVTLWMDGGLPPDPPDEEKCSSGGGGGAAAGGGGGGGGGDDSPTKAKARVRASGETSRERRSGILLSPALSSRSLAFPSPLRLCVSRAPRGQHHSRRPRPPPNPRLTASKASRDEMQRRTRRRKRRASPTGCAAR